MRTVQLDGGSVLSALDAAGMSWTPESRPVVVDGAQVTGYKALVRSDSAGLLGIVGCDYAPLTQEQAFAPAQALIDSGELTLTSAFEARGGSVVGLRGRIGPILAREVGGLYPEVTFVNTHDGSASWSATYQLRRLVCLNGMSRVAKSRAWRLTHKRHILSNLQALRLEFAEHRQQAQDAATLFAGLLTKRLSESNLRRYVRETLGPDGAGNDPEVAVRHVDQVMGYAETAPGAVPGTLYGGLNAVTYYATHARGRSDDARELATLFGGASALVERATNKAVAYASKLPDLQELGYLSAQATATAKAEFDLLLQKS